MNSKRGTNSKLCHQEASNMKDFIALNTYGQTVSQRFFFFLFPLTLYLRKMQMQMHDLIKLSSHFLPGCLWQTCERLNRPSLPTHDSHLILGTMVGTQEGGTKEETSGEIWVSQWVLVSTVISAILWFLNLGLLYSCGGRTWDVWCVLLPVLEYTN